MTIIEVVELLKAVIFGFMQGVTEWLPVSSTGHMILLNEFLPLYQSEEFLELFFVWLHSGGSASVLEAHGSLCCPRRLSPETGYSSFVGKDNRGLYSSRCGGAFME